MTPIARERIADVGIVVCGGLTGIALYHHDWLYVALNLTSAVLFIAWKHRPR